MSDQGAVETQSTAVASATQAMAIRQVKDEIGGIKKQIKTLWIVVGMVGTITLILAILTLLPRFGVRLGGFPARTGSGITNGQQFNGPGGTGGTGTQQPTAP
jgi:hypothetical protein